MIQTAVHLPVNFPFRKNSFSAECGGGAASATDVIAMTGAGAVQTPRKRPMDGQRGQVFMFGTKAVQRGVYSAPRGKCEPMGSWIAHKRPTRTSFHDVIHAIPPCPRGVGYPRMDCIMKAAWRGVHTAHRDGSARISPMAVGVRHILPRRMDRQHLLRSACNVLGGQWWRPPPPMVGRVVFTCNTYSAAYKGKPRKKTPFPKITEYTDTSVYYIPYFPYFPVPQPVEKCIQSRLIQTEYTAKISEYKALFGYSSITIRLGCIQFAAPPGFTADSESHAPSKPL